MIWIFVALAFFLLLLVLLVAIGFGVDFARHSHICYQLDEWHTYKPDYKNIAENSLNAIPVVFIVIVVLGVYLK